MKDNALIVETHGLTRDFKEVRALASLDLAIASGELFGLVGPDGAGKTTTLRLLAGLLDISDGSATVAGFDLKREAEAIKHHVGYMAQIFSLYGELSVVENLRFFAKMYDVADAEIGPRMDRLLDFAGLTEFKDRRGAYLSGGMQKKLALACTLIHEPEILLLDEPTTGVDPISRREFWGILTELHLGGTTIVVSTPYMDEADRCSRVGLMYTGHMIRCDTPRRLRAEIHGDVVVIRHEDWRSLRHLIEKTPGIRQVQTYGEALHLVVDSAEKRIPQIGELLRKEGLQGAEIRQAPARMEEAFISLIREREATLESAQEV